MSETAPAPVSSPPPVSALASVPQSDPDTAVPKPSEPPQSSPQQEDKAVHSPSPLPPSSPQQPLAPETSDQDIPSTNPKPTSSSSDKQEPEMADTKGTVPVAASPSPPNGTPATTKKETKRKSIGVPEHKTKKLQKKKSQVQLNTNAQAGEYYLIKLKGYSPWPAIVCDDDMLPQSLLQSRPASARRSDGTFSDACADGGKRVADRMFPVMFMATNEFMWTSNKDMVQYDFQQDVPEKAKGASLQQAYVVAKEAHDLEHWKSILLDHAQAMKEDAEMKAAKSAAKKDKTEKRRKSEVKAPSEDVEMEDAQNSGENGEEAEPTVKKGKKRPKAADSEGESAKPAKIAKQESAKKPTKIKISTPKAPNGTPSAKPSAKAASTAKAKPKKKSAVNGSDGDGTPNAEAAAAPKKKLTAQEQLEIKQKEVLYLRHKLQKCFLSGDQPPKSEDMKGMSEFIHKLEQYRDLEVSIIRATKINKVLKGIIKLSSIPQDAEFNFKQRSTDLLTAWNSLLREETGNAPAQAPTTNGVSASVEDKKSDEEPAAAPTPKEAPKPTETAASTEPEPSGEDTAMKDAPPVPTKEDSTESLAQRMKATVTDEAEESAINS
ncbi:MAG: hypothetical protein M1814_005872 [Vezdaea aestivalis]|nr:MAG: hypothetical protein M1814_005872 [Vezdaea aestivalis]